ncbi:NHLP family bacteriocin export ABC transporter peptidase/permease/ATPase subunit [Kineococcus sp. NUM-3379]
MRFPLRHPRVPVELQVTQTDCGAACLAMLLSALGRRTRAAEMRAALPPSVDGVSLRDLVTTAAGFGLPLRAVRLPAASLAGRRTPAIAWWRGNHYVVVERADAAHVHVVDPAEGRRRLTAGEFAAGYSGVLLLLAAPPDLAPAARTPSSWQLVRPLVLDSLRRPRLLAAVLVASLLAQLVGLGVPLLTRAVVSAPLEVDLRGLGVAAVLTAVFGAAVSWVRSAALVRLQTLAAGRVVGSLVERTLSLPYAFFQRRPSGDLLARLSGVAMLRELVTERSAGFAFDLVTGLSYLVLLALASPPVALATLLAGLLQGAVVVFTARRGLALSLAATQAGAAGGSALVETLTGIEGVKSTGGEDLALRRWRARHRTELALTAQRDRHVAAVQAVTDAVRLLLSAGLLLVVAAQVRDGGRLADLLALTALAGAAVAPLSSLLGIVHQVHAAAAYLDRVADIWSAEPERRGAVPSRPLRGAVELVGVSAGYDPRRPVLRDVSLRVAPGQRVAVVGASGSGKTTLGRVLLGLLEPAAGEVRYDGVPLSGLDVRWVRRQVGVVTQQAQLLSGTVLEAIADGDPSVGVDEAREAAVLAGLHEELAALPMGYATDIGEGGGRLSGGQRQRLALARALARRPALLLLDEPTANLDPLVEERIRRNLRDLGCAQIVIAHRLSTVRDADLVVVLDAGTVVEAGAPDELLGRDGTFRALWEAQMGAPVPR